MASQCWKPGRIEAAVRYSDTGQTAIDSGRHEVPFGIEGALGASYLVIGQPERCVEWCRAQLARGRDTHTLTRASLVLTQTFAGCGEEARAAANGLIEAAEATHNPGVLAYGLHAYGYAFRDADPAGALDALRRGLVIAQDSGNRYIESLLAGSLSRVEAEHGDPLAALDYLTLAIGNFQIARPQGRDDDHRRDGDLRLRPNRPGPSRTERRLEIELEVLFRDTSFQPSRERSMAACRHRCWPHF
jgi:hypothetical protein